MGAALYNSANMKKKDLLKLKGKFWSMELNFLDDFKFFR